jgi:hypothetical protein
MTILDMLGLAALVVGSLALGSFSIVLVFLAVMFRREREVLFVLLLWALFSVLVFVGVGHAALRMADLFVKGG